MQVSISLFPPRVFIPEVISSSPGPGEGVGGEMNYRRGLSLLLGSVHEH